MREEICLLHSKAVMKNIKGLDIARTMKVSPQYLSAVIHGREKPSSDFAERMEKAISELEKN